MIKDALRFIWYDKAKSAGILFGLVLSVFLVGQQLGVCFSLLGSIISIAENNSQYIWVVNNKSIQANDLPRIDTRIERELYSINGVTKVHPIVVGAGSTKFENGTKGVLTIIGTKAPTFAGGPWKFVAGNKQQLVTEGAIVTDQLDAPTQNNITPGDKFELNGKSVTLVGQTRGARGLGVAYGFMSIENARAICSISSTEASAFLVEWEAGTDGEIVAKRINEVIPGVKASTGRAFTSQTLTYFAENSGIVASFGLLVFFAVITGFAIVGLTLYSSVNDRIREYGTIKAIGGTNGFIRKFILLQAAILSCTGFAIAFSLLYFFVSATKDVLDIQLTAGLILSLIGVTLFIAMVSCLFAMRKITRLEPVQIFRM